MHFKLFTHCLLLSFLGAYSVHAQDTLRVSILQADSIFLRNNLSLIASSLNVEAGKAQVIQAKAYPNPIFTADLNAYDPENHQLFHIDKTGQKAFQLEQLIVLGGKRRSEIELAKTNAAIAALELEQLLRQLRFRLRSDLFTVGRQLFLLRKYNHQLDQLSALLAAYETQVSKGNVPPKDLVRLKGAWLKLSNDRAGLLELYYATQTSLQTLLNTSAVVEFQFSEDDVEKYIQLKDLSDILSAAQQHRPELLIVQQEQTLAEQNFLYQKRLAVPDVNLFTSYDQRGGAFGNQVNLGFTVPIPLWNRNQGNIKAAQIRIKEAGYKMQAAQNEIANSVRNAFAFYTHTVSEYQQAKTLYTEDFDITVNGMIENFQKRNVSIVEFIDFFEAYNEVLAEITRIKTQLVIAAEQINLLTGKDIY